MPRPYWNTPATLAIVRDFAQFLVGSRGKQDWALADVPDTEVFLATLLKGTAPRLITRGRSPSSRKRSTDGRNP